MTPFSDTASIAYLLSVFLCGLSIYIFFFKLELSTVRITERFLTFRLTVMLASFKKYCSNFCLIYISIKSFFSFDF